MDRKKEALDCFIDEIRRSPTSKNIAKIIHYGSTFKGDYSQESDIDVLLVATGDIKKVDEVISNISYDLLLSMGERIEPMIYCFEDYLYPGYFVYKVKNEGKEVFSMNEQELKRNEAIDLLVLAKKFNQMAKAIYQPENIRGVVDLAYNSAELCAKSLILLEGKDIPKSHGGIVNKFSELLVKSAKVRIELGRMLNRGLDKRNKARYDVHAAVSEEDAKPILELSDELIALLEEWIMGLDLENRINLTK